jgi:3-phenylpropionate/trans-cinnamate dioxygenase ferredoxin subunit
LRLCAVAAKFSDVKKQWLQHKKFQWHKVADSESEIQFADNHIAVIEVTGKTMCIGKHQQQLFAFAHKCPHAGGILAEGWIDATGNVVCPLHRYKFNITNGRNTTGEGYYLKQWPVEIREAGIFVGIEESGIFNWLGA